MGTSNSGTQIVCATSEDKGSRVTMEDATIIVEDARRDKSSLLRLAFMPSWVAWWTVLYADKSLSVGMEY